VNQPSLESFRLWLVTSEDEAVETELVDDVHFLETAKGRDFNRPPFILVKPSDSIASIFDSKRFADICCYKSDLVIYVNGPHSMLFELEFDRQSLALTAGGLSFMV